MSRRPYLLGSNSQYKRFTLDYFISDMLRLGIHKLDFVPQTPHFFCGPGSYEDPALLKTKLKASNLQIEVLSPPGYRYSITAPEGEQGEATLSYYKSCIKLASELECSRLAVGAYGACWDIEKKQLRNNAREILHQLCAFADRYGIVLLLLPVMGPETPLIAESPVLNTSSEFLEILEQVDSRNLGVCLDTNVMSSCDETLCDWFRQLKDKISLLRLCDGNYHGWRAWGQGVLPVKSYIKELELLDYEGDISLLLPDECYLQQPAYPHELALSAISEAKLLWRQ